MILRLVGSITAEEIKPIALADCILKTGVLIRLSAEINMVKL